MVLEKLEQEEITEEPTDQPEVEQEVPENDEELVPQEEGEVKPSATEEETLKRIDSEAQSIAAKATQTYQDKVKDLEKQLSDMTNASTKRQRDAELARQEGKELDEWGEISEVTVKDFQKTRREYETYVDTVSEAYAQFQIEQETMKKERNSNFALKLAIKYAMENGDEVIQRLDSFIKEIGEGTESEMELKALRFSLLKQPEKKKHVTDSTRRSAPGGENENKLKGDDAVKRGLEKMRKQQGG